MAPVLSRRGFTLPEILVATVLLSIGILAVLSSITVARQTQARLARMTSARVVANSMMEELRSVPLSTLDGLSTTSTSNMLPAGNQVLVTATRYPDEDHTRSLRVLVRVQWPEGSTTDEIIRESIIARF